MEKLCVILFLASYGYVSHANPLEVLDSVSRIAGGTAAADTQFPYATSLQEVALLAQTNRGHTCGGALLTLQHVVTTASCLYTLNAAGAYVLKTPGAYRVFAGAALLTNDTSADRWRGVQAFVPHPDYLGPPSSVNDIGVIVLSSAFPNNTGLTTLSLSTTAPADYTNCTVAGWGSTTPAATPLNSQLMFVYKHIYEQSQCAGVLNPQPSAPNVLPSMLCAAAYSTQSTSCTSDTGNALVCGGSLAGVLSWHPPCLSATTWPEVYTRAATYNTWLRAATGSAPAFGPAAPALAFSLLTATVLALFS